jgi:TolB-like protein
MSPEQVRAQGADFRSDIFALGAILYEMVSGRRAFTGGSSADVASAILKEDPPRLSRCISNVHKALESAIQRCLEKNPEDRFQSVEDLLVVLRGIETPAGVAVAHRWFFQSWRAAAVMAVLTAAVGLLASFFYFRNREALIDSIAVLPFVSTNVESGGEIGDGITSGLIDRLSQIPNLRVMSRSSVSRYKGQKIDPRVVGRELNVRTVLTGTITSRGPGFVLDAELVNTGNASHIWGQQYNRKASDALTLQAEMARTLSDKLRPRLSSEAKASLEKPGTSNLKAYSLYVKGRYSFDAWEPQHIKESLADFRQALEQDPAYAHAYGGMGDAYAVLAFYTSMPLEEGVQKAKAAAHRALELDANVAEAHCALGVAAYVGWEWLEAERETRRCEKLSPNLFFAHVYRSWVVGTIGHMDQSLAEIKLAVELDPISFIGNQFLGYDYYWSRDYDRAVEQLEKMIELEPNRPDLRDHLAASYAMKGESDKAALEYREVLRLEGKLDQAEAVRRAYANDGFRGLLKCQIRLWGDPKKADDYDPFEIAANYSLLGDRENAFLWLNRAYAEREKLGGGMLTIQVDPAFDNIRSDPRYTTLLRRMGFT